MIVKFRKRFFSDLSHIKSLEVLDEAEFLVDTLVLANSPGEIPGFKYLKGYKNKGRISIGVYA